jgi:rare lipoprotein A
MKRSKILLWAAIHWLPLLFVMVPAMEAPLVARPTEPIKPLKTWVGNASWYGPRFNGRKTANGERFDSEALTAAHPTLPFDSLVRIINTRTGQFEVVRINDRGPYQEGREIDVSYRVARKIGLIQPGVRQVRLELMALPETR